MAYIVNTANPVLHMEKTYKPLTMDDYTMQQVECSCPESWVDSGKHHWIINNEDLFNNDCNECFC